MERATAGGKVHGEFQFHISDLVSRSAGWLPVCLSTVQETDKIGVDGNGYSSSSSFSYNKVDWVKVVSQLVFRGCLAFFYLEEGKRGPGCRRKHHGKRKKEKEKKKTKTTSSTMM